jgi:hypothetical protein
MICCLPSSLSALHNPHSPTAQPYTHHKTPLSPLFIQKKKLLSVAPFFKREGCTASATLYRDSKIPPKSFERLHGTSIRLIVIHLVYAHIREPYRSCRRVELANPSGKLLNKVFVYSYSMDRGMVLAISLKAQCHLVI